MWECKDTVVKINIKSSLNNTEVTITELLQMGKLNQLKNSKEKKKEK